MRTMKRAAVVVLVGTMFNSFGCLNLGGNSWWSRVLYDGAMNVAWEFVLDNDGIFDLFEDDGNNTAGQ